MLGGAGIEQKPRRGRWILVAGCLVATIAFVALGFWQMQRLFWKQDLISRVEARLAAAAVPAPGRERWAGVTIADEYARVAVSGTYLHDKEALVTASTERGPGFWVLTPLVAADGTTIVVNRGFVDADHRRAETRAPLAASAAGSVVGLLRLSEANVWILRRNDPASDRWYRRDPIEIAGARGLRDAAPYFVDAEAVPGGPEWPVAGMTRLAFQNNHLAYALTWFVLAILGAVAAAFVVRHGHTAEIDVA